MPWWMVAVATTPPMRLTALNSCRTVYVIRFFRFIWGEKSHPLALPLAPLLLEGNASDVLRNAYQQYQDSFRELKVSLPKLQDECWWEGEHDGPGREQNITSPGCSFKSSAVAVWGTHHQSGAVAQQGGTMYLSRITLHTWPAFPSAVAASGGSR